MVKPQWLDQIYEDKDIEIRGQPCRPKIGQRIFLCPSGASAVTGTAVVADCLGPLTRPQRRMSLANGPDLGRDLIRHVGSPARPVKCLFSTQYGIGTRNQALAMINSTNTHIHKHQQCYNNTVRRMCYNLLT